MKTKIRVSRKRAFRIYKEHMNSIYVANLLKNGANRPSEFVASPKVWEQLVHILPLMAKDRDFTIDVKFKGSRIIKTSLEEWQKCVRDSE